MKMWLIILILLVAGIGVLVLWSRNAPGSNTNWLGVYYEGGDFSSPEYSDNRFDSMKQCASWAEEKYRNDDFEDKAKFKTIWYCYEDCIKESGSSPDNPSYLCEDSFSRGEWVGND